MRLFALDVGVRRTGLAMESRGLVMPFGVAEGNREEQVSFICQKIKNSTSPNDEICLVVGLPLDLSGEETSQSARARDLALLISERLACQARFVDERFTTSLAKRLEVESGASRDEVAAMILLEEFVKQNDIEALIS